MAPRPWATAEQSEWLRKRLPEFSNSVMASTVRRFWPKLNRAWAVAYPELDHLIATGQLPAWAKLPTGDNGDTSYDYTNERFTWTGDYERVYQAAIIAREKKLKNWMRYQRKKALGASGSGPVARSLALKLQGGSAVKKRRAHQEQEVYQRMYADKLRDQVKAELNAFPQPPGDQETDPEVSDDEDDEDWEDLTEFEKTVKGKLMTAKEVRSWHLKIRRRVVKRAWLSETAEVRAAVQEQLAEEKEADRMLSMDVEEQRGLERDEEKRVEVIGALSDALLGIAENIQELCGWSFCAMVGGPHPSFKKNAIISISSAYKTKVPAFPLAYDNFKEGVSRPFNIWLNRIYAQDSDIPSVDLTEVVPITAATPANVLDAEGLESFTGENHGGEMDVDLTNQDLPWSPPPASTSLPPLPSSELAPPSAPTTRTKQVNVPSSICDASAAIRDASATSTLDNATGDPRPPSTHPPTTILAPFVGSAPPTRPPTLTPTLALPANAGGTSQEALSTAEPLRNTTVSSITGSITRQDVDGGQNMQPGPSPIPALASGAASGGEHSVRVPRRPGSAWLAKNGAVSSTFCSPQGLPPLSPMARLAGLGARLRQEVETAGVSATSGAAEDALAVSVASASLPAAVPSESTSSPSATPSTPIPSATVTSVNSTATSTAPSTFVPAVSLQAATAAALTGPPPLRLTVKIPARTHAAKPAEVVAQPQGHPTRGPVITNIGSGVLLSQATRAALARLPVDGGAAVDGGSTIEGGACGGRGRGRGRGARGGCGRGRGGRGGAVGGHSEAGSVPTLQEDGNSDSIRVTLPSRAERARINKVNQLNKENAEASSRKRKTVDTSLHNPDGRSPLVVVPAPPADQWIQPEREKRIRKQKQIWEPMGQKEPAPKRKKTTK